MNLQVILVITSSKIIIKFIIIFNKYISAKGNKDLHINTVKMENKELHKTESIITVKLNINNIQIVKL
jgi:hypothetical protein